MSGPHGPVAVERFASAPGPLGWRYAATREHPVTGAPLGGLDLVLDAHGRVLRLQVTAAGWELRGGAVGTDEVLWRRGEVEHQAAAQGFTGSSPAFALAAVRRLRPQADGVRARFAAIGDDALAVLLVDQHWRPASTGEPGLAYTVQDLATGGQGTVLLDGDVVRAAPGAVLLSLEPRLDSSAATLTIFEEQP